MIGVAVVLVVAAAVAGPVRADDLAGALERTRELVGQHRYRDAIDILDPYHGLKEPEARYAVAAETGRAFFHLGDYAAANRWLREAVALCPQRVETALYLQAASYLVGDRDQAYAIFREILHSGATDLYLAVTLPGERRFMADAAVWEILDAAAIRVDVDLDRGAILGVELGRPRAEVETTLTAEAGDEGSALTARAGPYLTWVFGFDNADSLAQIMLHADHLLRYTPFRLHFAAGMDWRTTPATAMTALGAPTDTTGGRDDLVVMTWDRDGARVTLEFALPRPPVPPGLAAGQPALRTVRIEAVPAVLAGRAP